MKDRVLKCVFASRGFDHYRPCRTIYHQQCFRVGLPFTSRRVRQAGLCCPPLDTWPSFICEACTVRSVARRELHAPTDLGLLALERMRILDMMSYWAKGTHDTYQSKLNIVHRFEQHFDVSILTPTQLDRPPCGPEIPLMWCLEAYSTRTSSRSKEDGIFVALQYDTIRQLRSAASQFWTWDTMVASPSSILTSDRRILSQQCRPSDRLSMTLHASGLRARIGDEARPSVALLDQHIRAMLTHLDGEYRGACTPYQRRHFALAGFATLLLWLGWLRSGELLSLHWDDVRVTEPEDGPTLALPQGCGAVQLYLKPETKSHRFKRADVIMAYKTLSGLFLGKWYHRAKRYSYLLLPTSPIFCHLDGSPWTSLFFRTTFLYPSLAKQRRDGDPYLTPFNGPSGSLNSLEAKFWSLHCFRRGARSHVSRGGRFGKHRLRKATRDQVYEHGRWHYRRSSEPIDVIYREWVPFDRIKLTLYSH